VPVEVLDIIEDTPSPEVEADHVLVADHDRVAVDIPFAVAVQILFDYAYFDPGTHFSVFDFNQLCCWLSIVINKGPSRQSRQL